MTAEPSSTSPAPFDPSRIRAVAFDGYGTLFEYGMPQFRIDMAAQLAEQGVEVEDYEAFFLTWQRSYRAGDVWDQTDRAEPGPRGWPTQSALNGPLPDWHSQWEIWRRQFQAASDHHQIDADAGAVADCFRGTLSDAPAYLDAHDTVEGLAARGYLLGLLSNADEDFLQAALSRARLRFSVIQSSESLRAYKPHRSIFLALAGRFGVAPEEILYVGDSPFADVAGAANAGLRTAWIRREEAPFPEHIASPDVTLTALADLLDVLPAR